MTPQAFWPFHPPQVAGIVNKLSETIYYAGVKDGIIVACIAGIFLYLFFAGRSSPSSPS